MTLQEASAVALPVAVVGLLWACGYLVLGRTAALETMPGCIRRRVQRTCSLASYVAVVCIVLLAAGVAVSLGAR